jgi:hypothetical protein
MPPDGGQDLRMDLLLRRMFVMLVTDEAKRLLHPQINILYFSDSYSCSNVQYHATARFSDVLQALGPCDLDRIG